jgi:hypothetical protein
MCPASAAPAKLLSAQHAFAKLSCAFSVLNHWQDHGRFSWLTTDADYSGRS